MVPSCGTYRRHVAGAPLPCVESCAANALAYEFVPVGLGRSPHFVEPSCVGSGPLGSRDVASTLRARDRNPPQLLQVVELYPHPDLAFGMFDLVASDKSMLVAIAPVGIPDLGKQREVGMMEAAPSRSGFGADHLIQKPARCFSLLRGAWSIGKPSQRFDGSLPVSQATTFPTHSQTQPYRPVSFGWSTTIIQN